LPDLFNVKLREGEFFKDYLNRFCAVSVRLQTLNEDMVIVAFVKGVAVSPFSNSLFRNMAESLSEIRERVATHIEAEEDIRTEV